MGQGLGAQIMFRTGLVEILKFQPVQTSVLDCAPHFLNKTSCQGSSLVYVFLNLSANGPEFAAVWKLQACLKFSSVPSRAVFIFVTDFVWDDTSKISSDSITLVTNFFLF
jgi:hypothetical protein